ncbi:MAG: hypothetical protein AAB547_03755 [Patescibacteria group bacterium]
MPMHFETPEEIAKKNAQFAQQAAIEDKIRQLEPDQLSSVLDNIEHWIGEHNEELRDPETRARVQRLREELEKLLETTKPH